jgi:hypothetical protein
MNKKKASWQWYGEVDYGFIYKQNYAQVYTTNFHRINLEWEIEMYKYWGIRAG